MLAILSPSIFVDPAEARSYRNSRYRYPYSRNRYKDRYRYRYGYGYHKSTRPNYSNPNVEGRETRKFTTWEAPTREDNLINEEIEKAQVDYGPTSKEVGQLMMKYARRYYEARDFEKARKMTDRILKLDKVSKFDGIKMADVTKLRADAIKMGRPPANPHRSSPSKGIIIGDYQYKNRKPVQRHVSKTAIAQVKHRYPGLTEIDYSGSAVKQARSQTTSTMAVTRSLNTRSSQWLKNYKPVRMPYGHRSLNSLDKLGGQFEQYK